MSVQLIDLTLELLILGGQRAVGFLGFAELGRDKLCCLIIASLSGLLGLSHSVLQTSILRLELLHLTGKIGDLRIKVVTSGPESGWPDRRLPPDVQEPRRFP